MLRAAIYRDLDDGTVMFDRDVRDRDWDRVELIALVTDNASSARLDPGDRGWHGLVVGPTSYSAEDVLAGACEWGGVTVRSLTGGDDDG